MQDTGASAFSKALTTIPEATQDAGLLIARADELRTTAQRALDTTKAYQDWLQQYQAQQATLQQGDYRTLPEETLRTGRQLAVDVAYAHKLDKPSQQLFEARTQDAMTVAQEKALEIQARRRGQDTILTTAQLVQGHQERMAFATTEADRLIARADMEHDVSNLVQAGLLGGAEGAKIIRDTTLTVQKDRALLANRANPMQAVNELQGITQALNEGQTPTITTEAYRNLPPTMLPALLDDAYSQLRESASMRDQNTRYVTARRKELQDQNEVRYRGDLVQLEPRPENYAAIQQQVRRIQAAGPAGELSQEGYGQLTALGQTWLEKARKPPEQYDDPAIESQLSLKLALASTPQDFTDLRHDLERGAAHLKPETVRSLGTSIETRANTAFYGNRATYKQGRQAIMDAAVPGATILFPQFLKEEERYRLRNVLQAYDDAWGAVDPRQGDIQVPEFARQAIDSFIQTPFANENLLLLLLQRGGEGGT